MVLTGILCGLAAAMCQSLSYLGTRHFVHPRGGGIRQLLVLSHVLMGAVSIIALPLIWPRGLRPGREFFSPLFLSTVFYVIGQIGLLVTLRYAEPSRVSPMLAFKLIVLVGLTLLLTNNSISGLQWLAVLLCLVGAISLNYTGGANHPKAVVWLVVACIGYSLCDWNIARLVHSLSSLPMWQAYSCAVLTCYSLCGLIALLFVPLNGSRQARDWIDAAPFAAAWLAAMLFLFASFGLVGVIYSNILQSTRGLISVILGSILASAGLLHLEKAAAPGVFRRRLAAAALIAAAAVLYGREVHRLAVPVKSATAIPKAAAREIRNSKPEIRNKSEARMLE